MPCGPLNCADARAPSTWPSALPVSVVTALVVTSIARIKLFPLSTTKSVPSESTATDHGRKKSALVPTSSVVPDAVPPAPPPPASVVTAPAASIARTRWLKVSATYTIPPDTTRPRGPLNFAFVPSASM